MIKYPIKKLFHGYASVRSPIVDKALLLHEGLLIELEETGEIMEVPYEEIVRKGRWGKNRFKSKHREEFYVLVDFPWKATSKQKVLI